MNPVYRFFSSLRLTVVLLAISVLLVFLGSLAQVPEGLWNAQVRWFKSWVIIRQPGDALFVPPIFPGGHLLGLLLVINLLAAHFKRFQWTFQKFGIQLTHLGIIVVLVGQLATDKLSRESVLSFTEGETQAFTEHHRDVELVFTHEANANQNEVISFPQALVASKKAMLEPLSHPKLPFTVRVRDYHVNGALLSLADMEGAAKNVQWALTALESKYANPEQLPAQAKLDEGNPTLSVAWRKVLRAMKEDDVEIAKTVARIAADPARGKDLAQRIKAQLRTEMMDAFDQMGKDDLRWNEPQLGSETAYAAELERKGLGKQATELTPAASNGVGRSLHAIPRDESKSDNDGRNFNWAIVEITEGAKSLGTWLVSTRLNGGQSFEAGGQKWKVALRNERFPMSFGVQLLRARQESYQGTAQAREYASRVRIINPATGEDRETDISMNQPLRYEGLTFFQSSMNQGDKGPGAAAFMEALTGRPRSEFAGIEEKQGGRFSGLQTVENPSMLAPYTGCLLVGFGMLWQFLYHLTGFLAKRTGLPSPAFGVPSALLPICAVMIMVPDIFIAWIAIQNGSPFALAVVAVTPFIRAVLAWEVWKGRHLVFAMVLLFVPTTIAAPFAVKYWSTHGMMLGPVVVAQFIAFFGLAYIVFSHRPQTATTTPAAPAASV